MATAAAEVGIIPKGHNPQRAQSPHTLQGIADIAEKDG